MIARLRRRVLRRLLLALGRGQGAHRIALAFAVGIAVGLSPFFGFQIVISLALALYFRLDKLDVVLGSFIVNPLTVVPIYSAATSLGMALLGQNMNGLAQLPWREMSSLAFWRDQGFAAFGPYLGAFLLGSTLFSVVGAVASYVIVRRALEAISRRRVRRRRKRGAALRATVVTRQP